MKGNPSYKYRTRFNVAKCITVNYLLFLLAAFIMEVLSLLNVIPDKYFFKSLLSLYILLLILDWVFFFRAILFYEDELVVFYPIRPFARRLHIQYDEIDEITYIEPNRLPYDTLSLSLKNASRKRQFYVKHFCDGDVVLNSRGEHRKFLYLLRFLKQKGVVFRAKATIYGELNISYAARLEAVFGPNDKTIYLPSHKHREVEYRADAWLVLICIIFVVILAVFISCLVQ